MYRGMMPTFWQMLRGEKAATITVHRMAEKLDAGDVLATQDFAIRTFDSLDRVILGTKREGARLVIRVLLDLRAGLTRPTPLDMTAARYFSFPKSEHVREFRKRGHQLL
jgi:methionyl-tRNA formyltransferase